ncbi:MAG: peptidoglycan DD-metalloendopeptidase family protein [Desulfobulbaceae bacterium]|nr:peptidoglycan DD-metalloendopeptidase family protein [Desulfobulbaceae bacterium]
MQPSYGSSLDFVPLFNEYLTNKNPHISFAPPRGWILHRDMRFGSSYTWWGESKERPVPHEGVDLLHYVNRNGVPSTLTSSICLVSPIEGNVLRVSKDFLGQSVWLRHSEITSRGTLLHSVYAHIEADTGISEGVSVGRGGVIGTIIEKQSSGAPPGHLHLSLFFAPKSLPRDSLDWSFLSSHPDVRLIDPLQSIF